MSLEKRIEELRKKLDDSISQNKSYDEIYQISLKLDELIVEYYRNVEKNKTILK